MVYWFGGVPLLKYVLARKLLDAGFLACLQTDLRFMVSMRVIWHAWCLYFGVLGDPGTILEPFWDDPGTILGHWGAQGTTLRGPGLDFTDFWLIEEFHFDSMFGTFGQNMNSSFFFPGCFF